MADGRKRHLFERGVEAARWAGSRVGPYYYCPLCGRGFSEDALDPEAPHENRLTEEHVPPKSVGGVPLVLTCWLCNNWAGVTVDAELAKREEQHRFLDAGALKQGEYSGPGRLRLGELELNVDMELEPDGGTFRVLSERNAPETYEKARELYEEADRDGLKFNVSPVRRFHHRKAKIGDLKSAFLIGFAAFGYLWAEHPAVKLVRRQILHPSEEVLEADAFWQWVGWEEDPDLMWLGTAWDPTHLLLVRLGRRTVLLPGWTAPPTFYDAAAEHFGGEEPTRLQLTPVPWPLTLVAELDRENHRQRGMAG